MNNNYYPRTKVDYAVYDLCVNNKKSYTQTQYALGFNRRTDVGNCIAQMRKRAKKLNDDSLIVYELIVKRKVDKEDVSRLLNIPMEQINTYLNDLYKVDTFRNKRKQN